MYGEKYKKMSADCKLFYMICLDLIKLSMKKGWKDEQGRYYIKMSLETIKERMNCQNTKAVNLKKELIKHDLMEVVRVGQGKADRLYILQLEYTDEDIYKANHDHEDIKNDEEEDSGTFGSLQPQENSGNRSSRTPKIGELELHKSETIKNKFTKTNPLRTKSSNNQYITDIDDDKRTHSHNEEEINLIISNFREATKTELTDRSFKAVVRKVIDKYNQGKVNSFRDYLATALTRKMEELELRKEQAKAKEELSEDKQRRLQQKANKLRKTEIKRDVVFYNWLEE